MSYSFNVRAPSKADALDKFDAEFATVVERMPIHESDRAATHDAVAALLELTADPSEGHEVSLSVAGSCYRPNGENDSGPLAGVSLNVNVSHLAVQQA